MKMPKKKIQVVECGDQVTDEVTGFKGIVMAICEHLHGCRRCAIQPKVGKDGKNIESLWIDEPQIKITKKGVVKGTEPDAALTGGPKSYPKNNSKDPR